MHIFSNLKDQIIINLFFIKLDYQTSFIKKYRFKPKAIWSIISNFRNIPSKRETGK